MEVEYEEVEDRETSEGSETSPSGAVMIVPPPFTLSELIECITP